MRVSTELESWARLAEFSLTRDAEDGQADIFWNRGGEVRYLIRERADGWIEVSASDRLGPEYFIFMGASAVVIERFLFGWFGGTYRSVRGMPNLATPRSADEMASGYRIAVQNIDGIDRYALVDPADQLVAVSSGGRIMAPGRLATVSVLLNASVDEAEESFRSEDGLPLFGIRS